MPQSDAPVLAWHFAAEDRRLQYGDGREIVPGVTFRAEGPLRMCNNGNGFGLFGSVRALDALRYGAGPIVSRVELRDEIVAGCDKHCARERHHLWVVDASDALRSFARQCAADVLHLWNAPQVVRDYLATGDEALRAAAWDAARDAAWAAARAAARAAAWAAAGDAAGDAARDAAWAAARDAAGAAAGAAARAAARDAAWAAAGAAQNARLESMLLALAPEVGHAE